MFGAIPGYSRAQAATSGSVITRPSRKQSAIGTSDSSGNASHGVSLCAG